MEDLDLESSRDNEDDIVSDVGFASRSSWAQKAARQLKKSRKPSDEVANGDRMEDLDLESSRDAEDDIVSDVGFASRSSWAQKSARQLKKSRKPSDEVANGDRMEDLDLESSRDNEDDIVSDVGFASRSSWAQKAARQLKKSRKPSDEVANGDRMEDLDLESSRDAEDDIVSDVGFASRSSWAQKSARQLKKSRKPSDEVANGDRMEDLDLESSRDNEDDIVSDVGFASRSSWAQKAARHFKKSRKPSDEVANGDRMEDLDLESSRDAEDDIVSDVGFASRSSWAQMPRHYRRNYIQTSGDVPPVKPSDEVANGDEKEDLEVLNERDDEDGIVQDVGFAARSSWVQLGYSFDKPSDEVANGDEKEDLEVQNERDPEDAIVQDVGFAARSSWAQLEDDVKAPKKDQKKKAAPKYSDELANGDSFDDKELEDVRDKEDYVVDDNGFGVRQSWIQIRADLQTEALS
jgi:hypothetical protein